MEIWAAMRVQSGHESDEQSVAGQAVYRTSNFQDAGQKSVEWLG